jgi:hypothetical protein
MTHKEIIQKQLNNGWYFQEIKYTEPSITIYRLEKRDKKDNAITNISYIIGKSSLKFFPQAKIRKANKTSVALNFIPYIPQRNHCLI